MATQNSSSPATSKTSPHRDRAKQRQRAKELALIKVAVSVAGPTKKAIAAALREQGIGGTSANVEDVLRLRKEFERKRGLRLEERAARRLGRQVDVLPIPWGRAQVRLPAGGPASRLDALRRNSVIQNAKGALRHGAPGGTSFDVKFVASSSEAGYEVSLGRTYDIYGGSFKGWGANIDNHQIRVPADWRLRVQRRGLAVLGGLFTLDVLPLDAPPGISLYAATWAAQGRGYEVKTETGYIAKSGPEHFHAASAEAAVRGLLRKRVTQKERMETLRDLASSVNDFADKYGKYRDVEVELEDARKSGSCEYGIRSWCHAVGIDMSRFRAPMREILAGFRQIPLPEVRRAVLRAVRRSRKDALRGNATPT